MAASLGPLAVVFEARHEAVRDTARALAEELETLGLPLEREGASRIGLYAIAREMVERMGRAGLLAHAVPDPAGLGASLDLRALCVAREELAFSSGIADALLAVQGLATFPVALAAEGALRARTLEEARAGRRIGAFALTEPNAGSDVAAIETVALPEPGGYVLEGRKTFISNAGLADFHVVFAKTDARAGVHGLSAFLVDADTAGLTDRPIDLTAPHPIGELSLEEVHVPASRRLGAEGDGFRLAMATLDVFRASVGAAACGLAARALDEAIARATVRRQFGRALAEMQAIQFQLADMVSELDGARALVFRAATAYDLGAARTTRESSIAKLVATEAAQRIVDRAVQIWGGLGVTRGVTVERLYREVRALRIYEGTSEIQRLVIARELLRPRAETSSQSPRPKAKGPEAEGRDR